MENIKYLLALHSIEGLGPIRLKAVLDHFKDPKVGWEAGEDELIKIGIPKNVALRVASARNTLDPDQLMPQLEKDNIKVLTIFDDSYPALLKEIYDPLIILYYKGELSVLKTTCIAVVGSRKMTGYGKSVTEEFSHDLVSHGVTVVSGLARGIDSTAHKKVVESKGKTIAVLGGGLNRIYPPENKMLADSIEASGGVVISEFPSDYSSLPGNFPARNRIISGLSLGVLVVEAAVDSGSLITAKLALEQGREVFAVPGPITSELSRGPMNLIKMGARAVFEAQDILNELGIGTQKQNLELKAQIYDSMTENEKKIINCLENESLHVDEICRILNLSSSQISASLLKMEISGIVRSLGAGVYCMTKTAMR